MIVRDVLNWAGNLNGLVVPLKPGGKESGGSGISCGHGLGDDNDDEHSGALT